MTHFCAPMMPVQVHMDRQQIGPKKWKNAIEDSIEQKTGFLFSSEPAMGKQPTRRKNEPPLKANTLQ